MEWDLVVLNSALDTAGSKLPDLGSLVKMITGGEDKKETKKTKVTDPAATGGGQPTTTESGSKWVRLMLRRVITSLTLVRI